MPLPIRDGNQSLTTLSTILVNSAHIPAHTVTSLGSQAITDIAGAVSGVELGPNTLNALENIQVSISAGSSITIGNVVSVTGGLTNSELRASAVTISGSVQANIANSLTISSMPSVTGSVSVLNFPATQPVTFGQAVVSASNIGLLNASVATDGVSDATLNFIKIGGHQSGSNQTSHIVHVSAGGSMSVDASGSSVTFTQASVTFSGVSISNFPATQSVTGSVSISGTPSITFGQASITFGAITGSVSVLNFPSTQTVAGTVTANLSSVSIGSGAILAAGSRSGTITPIPLDTGSGRVAGSSVVQYSTGAAYQDVTSSFPLPVQVVSQGSVTIGNSVTISSLPNIAGTVTIGGFSSVSVGGELGGILISGSRSGSAYNIVLDPGTGLLATIPQVPNGSGGYSNISDSLPMPVKGTITIGSLPSISGTVTVGNSLTISNFPASQTVAGTVTANLSSTNLNAVTIGVRGTVTLGDIIGGVPWVSGQDESAVEIAPGVGYIADITNSGNTNLTKESTPFPVKILGGSVTVGSIPAISGTVTANINGTVPISIASVTIGNSVTISGVPGGALTTRFGSVTTANTAQISSAVTNVSRKYLLIQNVTTSSNVITIGVGFTPTTTQGIQLTAGAGIIFESSYIPTGAVYVLSSVTASPFTILEA